MSPFYYQAGETAIRQLVLPFLLFFLLAFGAFQIWYLDRLALRAGDLANE